MSDDLQERLVAILAPHFSGGVRPPGELALIRALTEILTPGGGLDRRALNEVLPWTGRDFWVAGTVPTGSNIAQELVVRQPARLIYLDARAKTGPAGSALTMTVTASGVSENVSITAGSRSGTAAPRDARLAAGSVLVLNASSAGGAANLTVTAWLVPDYR